MNKTINRYSKIAIISVFALVLFAIVNWCMWDNAMAGSKDTDFWGTKIDDVRYYKVDDNTMEEGIGVDQNSSVATKVNNVWLTNHKSESGNYRYDIKGHKYEIKNFLLEFYDTWESSTHNKIILEYNQDTYDWDWSNNYYRVTLQINFFDVDSNKWQTREVKHYFKDKKDGWDDQTDFVLEDELVSCIQNSTKCKSIKDAVKDGKCEMHLSELAATQYGGKIDDDK